ncbi:hypothetical protein [Terrisporobacter sp.]|uniref:hypothetical protein n=1 Tax=Terrisporobacter sp. TaxID=1965305 RepID=UPI00261708B0|nr:hypothetical protein [Terrisporobacter sp.]
MNCKIQIVTDSTNYYIYVAYLDCSKIIHRDLINRYDTSLYRNAVKEVVKHIFKYKSLGIDVEINKERNINNMWNLDKLMKALEF